MTITKNRPTKKNAINYAMYEELGQALQEGSLWKTAHSFFLLFF